MTTVTVLPTPPTIADPVNFDVRADAFLLALQQFSVDMNSMVPVINSAPTYAASAAASAAAAEAATNYRGEWNTLSGALNIPASVTYSSVTGNAIWLLLANTSNVATIVPGTSSQWLLTNPDNSLLNSLIWS